MYKNGRMEVMTIAFVTAVLAAVRSMLNDYYDEKCIGYSMSVRTDDIYDTILCFEGNAMLLEPF